MAASGGSSNLSLSGVSIGKEKDNYIFHEKIFPPLTLERIRNITSENNYSISLQCFGSGYVSDPNSVGSTDPIREDKNDPQ
jgi:hypothetical protein